MNTGIQDAALLGTMLADVLTGHADPDTLDGYQALRRPVAGDVVRMTDGMTRAATLHGPAARLRNLALRMVTSRAAVRRKIAMNLSELSTTPERPRQPVTPVTT
jgi:2-polyprenyl-6-methoxyphenol hydroxylase-like FAD-dependent oxidoreductase